MKVIKFAMNEQAYDQFKANCEKEGITVKKKLNVVISLDRNPADIKSYYPENCHENITENLTGTSPETGVKTEKTRIPHLPNCSRFHRDTGVSTAEERGL